ncbi:MAG: glycosyltransferase family 2 protein [SAR324 cluster bacterium]|uniref:Glycosyltransferase family 2 protein n=1 Tax=SAR324 cluster bacterium TaxID=2024889 RepID=A0A7X9FTE8_9DELT|nr:glycosyltransferase family 2 protein [SAR324 cluster bacterium]
MGAVLQVNPDSTQGISVVIPVYNEEENVLHCYEELSGILRKMKLPYELIFVDDGSRDSSMRILKHAANEDPNVKIIEFMRNFGQTQAMAAGFEHSQYDIVIPIDGDLQNDPAEIPMMVSKLQEGFDVVAGWRKNRQDKFWSRKLPSKIANWIISRVTKVQLHDYGCSLKVLRGDIARGLRLYGEMHRFIPALAYEMGARVTEVPVNHRPRKFGKTKYGISRTFRVILDLMTVKFLLGYAKRPIHLFGGLGMLSGILGTLLLAWTTYERFFRHIPMGNRPLLILGVMLVLIGLQFVVFGLLAELLARTYYESQDKRPYFIRNISVSGKKQAGDEAKWKKEATH